jgi:hypothetical protein
MGMRCLLLACLNTRTSSVHLMANLLCAAEVILETLVGDAATRTSIVD